MAIQSVKDPEGTDPSNPEPAFDPSIFIGRIKANWRLLVPLLAIAGVLSIVYLNIVQYTYTAQAVIGPSTSQQSQAASLAGVASSLAGGMGGMLSGLLGGSQDNRFQEVLALLNSHAMAEALYQKNWVLATVFPNKWDAATNSWKSSGGPIRAVKDSVKAVLSLPIEKHPTADDLYTFLQKKLTVTQPFNSQLVTVSLVAGSRQSAVRLLHTIIAEADQMLRERQTVDEQTRIAYLESLLPRVHVSDQRTALITLLSSEQQTMMILHADKYYAIGLVDPAAAPRSLRSPKAGVVLALAIVISLMLWIALALLLRDTHPIKTYVNNWRPGRQDWRSLVTFPRHVRKSRKRR